jgi:hypothetical protein
VSGKSVWVATRKGTFKVQKVAGRWQAALAGHAGTSVNYVARDPMTNRLWALLGHGHWGAKLSISDDDGATWRDNPAQVNIPKAHVTSGKTCTRTRAASSASAGKRRHATRRC